MKYIKRDLIHTRDFFVAGKSIPMIIGGIAVSVLVVGGIYLYFSYRNVNDSVVTIEFSKPDEIFLGEPFDVNISISNISESILKEAKLVLSLPDGISFVGGARNQRIIEQAVGDLSPHKIHQQRFTLIALQGEQSLQRIEAKLLYRLPGSSAQFRVISEVDISAGEPVIELTVQTPERVVSGEVFETKIKYRNNSNEKFTNLVLRLEYPQIFQIIDVSNPARNTRNTEWEIKELEAKQTGELVIKGKTTGEEETFFTLKALLEAQISGETFEISNVESNISIASSPLSANILLNRSSTYVARAGETIAYAIRFKNNSETTFEKVTVTSELVGDMFDYASLQSSAAFNSRDNTLEWSAANTPALALLAPGEEREVEFRVDLKDEFPIRRLGDKNFTLKVNARVESPTVPTGTAIERTVTFISLETKVGGKLDVDARAFYRDANSGILNAGVYPPQVNQPTQYTVHWVVSAHAVDVSNVQLTSFIQSGGKWTGMVKSNISILPSYDVALNRITWSIPALQANKGVIVDPAEAIFQIELTPAVNQVGSRVTILGETTIQGQDNFTGLVLTDADGELTTDLLDDTTITESDRRVRP